MPTRGPSGKGDDPTPPLGQGGSPNPGNTPSLGNLGSYRGTPERLAALSHRTARESQASAYRRAERFSQGLLQQAYALSGELKGTEYETVGKNALLAAQKVYQDARVAMAASRQSKSASALYRQTGTKEDLQYKIEQAKRANDLRDAHERSARQASMLFRMIAQKGVSNVGKEQTPEANWYRTYTEQLKRNPTSVSSNIISAANVGQGTSGSPSDIRAYGLDKNTWSRSIVGGGPGTGAGGAGGPAGGGAPPGGPDDPDPGDDDFDEDDSDDPDMRRRKALLRRRRKARRRREARKQSQYARSQQAQKRQAAASLRYQKSQAGKQYSQRRKLMAKKRSRRKANRRREQRNVTREKKQAALYLRQQKAREKNQYAQRRKLTAKRRTRRKANRRRTERHAAREKRQAALYLKQQKVRETNDRSRRRKIGSRQRQRRKNTQRREERRTLTHQRNQRIQRMKTLASLGIASFAGHQAASGNFMGAAATVAWASGNPYAIAATELAHITMIAVKSLKNFADNTFEANKSLSKYSGVISNAYGTMRIHEIRRGFEYATGTQTTAKELVVSMDKMRDSWQKINISTGNAFNTVSSLVASGYASFGRGATPGYTRSVDFLTGAARSKVLGTDSSVVDVVGGFFGGVGTLAGELARWTTFFPRMAVSGARALGILGPATDEEKAEEPAHLRFIKDIRDSRETPPAHRLTAGMRGTAGPPVWAGRR